MVGLLRNSYPEKRRIISNVQDNTPDRLMCLDGDAYVERCADAALAGD
jgi:hypothetical protein